MDREDVLKHINADRSEFSLEVRESVGSTNDSVRKLAQEGKTGIFIAENQTSGRGRLGRSFLSPKGGVYISFILSPKGGIERNLSLMPLSSLCVCKAVERVTGVDCLVKWPNDCEAGGKKICGILSEGLFNGADQFLIVGIGINVNSRISDSVGTAASLLDLTGKTYSLPAVAAAVCDEFLSMTKNFPENESFLTEEYEKRCSTLGKEVIVTVSGKRISGTAVGIGEGCCLKVSDGQRIYNIKSGEATLRE